MPIVKGLRRFTSNVVSSNRAVTEISNSVPGSNVQQSERSSVAPVTSKRPIRKRVNSDDRKAMLESFVERYRAMNLGKFPSPTSAQKEVGGSYYLIRKMLQEMEYNSKFSSVDKGLVKENQKQTKVKDTIKSSRTKERSNSQTNDQHICEDFLPEPNSNSDKNFELKEGLQPSTSSVDAGNSNITRDDTHNIATENHDIRGVCHEKPECNVKDKFPSEDGVDLNDSEPKVEHQHDRIRNVMRDVPENQKADNLKEKRSIWGNLKSLATGFINIWKKQ